MDEKLEARVRAAQTWPKKSPVAMSFDEMRCELTDLRDLISSIPLAAIPEPAPVEPRVEIGGVYVTWSAPNFTVHHQFERDWVTPSAVGIVNYYLADNIERDAKVLELFALRDGADAKDAQIAALKRDVRAIERERDAVRANAERCEAAYDKLTAEIAALKAKASTPQKVEAWLTIHKDGLRRVHERYEHATRETEANYSEIAVPLYRHPPTPAERPVIGHAVIRDEHIVTWLNESKTLEQLREATLLHAKHHGGIVYELLQGNTVRGDALGEK